LGFSIHAAVAAILAFSAGGAKNVSFLPALRAGGELGFLHSVYSARPAS